MRGVVRFRGNNAFVSVPGIPCDLVINEKTNRHRCMSNDVVVVRILPEEDWMIRDAPKLVKFPNIPDDKVPSCEVVFIEHPHGSNAIHMCRLELNSNDQPEELDEDSALHASSDIVDCGEAMTSKGLPLRAVPLNRNIPWILLSQNHLKGVSFPIFRKPRAGVPEEEGKKFLLDRFELFPVRISSWKPDARNPQGEVTGPSVGRGDLPEVIMQQVMSANELDGHLEPFSDAVMQEVEDILKRTQENEAAEIARRVDLKHLRVMTIDPATAKDLDDAIHMVVLPNAGGEGKNHYEFGVHIADVSHFIPEGSALDQMAMEKCLTAYLPPKAFHMLPGALCANLCSLDAGENKYAYTTIFRVDHEGKLLPLPETPTAVPQNPSEPMIDPPGTFTPRFFRSVISSVCRFTYEQAQELIDGRDIALEHRPIVYGNTTWGEIAEDIVELDRITQRIRKHRFDVGGFRLEKTKLRFKLDAEMYPTSFEAEGHTTSHELVEELMLMANRVVAEKLFRSPFKHFSVLRNHPTPLADRAEKLEKMLQKFGLRPSLMSAKTIREFMESVSHSHGEHFLTVFQAMMMKTMQPASYIVPAASTIAEEAEQVYKDCFHFALCFDLYTHFTSPIRRYPDILVHRALSAVLTAEAEHYLPPRAAVQTPGEPTKYELVADEDAKDQFGLDGPKYRTNVELNNTRKDQSRKMQEAADRSFFALYVRRQPKPLEALAFITDVKPGSVNIHVPAINTDMEIKFEKHVLSNRMEILKSTDVHHRTAFTLPRRIEALHQFAAIVDWSQEKPGAMKDRRAAYKAAVQQAEQEGRELTKEEKQAYHEPRIEYTPGPGSDLEKGIVFLDKNTLPKHLQKLELFAPIPVVCCANDQVPLEVACYMISPESEAYERILRTQFDEKLARRPDGKPYVVFDVDKVNAENPPTAAERQAALRQLADRENRAEGGHKKEGEGKAPKAHREGNVKSLSKHDYAKQQQRKSR